MDEAAASQVAEETEDDWLSLQDASVTLGVSPSTVRRWADAGRIPARRTAGGHRRFDGDAVRALAGSRDDPTHPERGLAWRVSPQALARQPWHAHLVDTPAAEQMRGLGQRLLGLLIQYLVWQGDKSRFLADGRKVGASYGALARQAGVSLIETTEAFLYFRGTFWRLALQTPAVVHTEDVDEMMQLTERIDHFMNEVLLATIGSYELEPPAAAAPEAAG